LFILWQEKKIIAKRTSLRRVQRLIAKDLSLVYEGTAARSDILLKQGSIPMPLGGYMKRGLKVRKRLVYKRVKIGFFVLVLLVFLVWGVLTALATMDFFSGKVVV